ncbi:3-hydroxyanthranilate 3,4-dioxygenase [Pseudonocardia sp. CA-142604]|uniref:3-hydroxyanthranilate 3,4-dioxygenase n=1 Tax=Pseudonocardia sp. CA-142604 TaxID=3240024 RepID=UPI003D911B34
MTDNEPTPPFVQEPTPQVLNFTEWLTENAPLLRPPVNNKVIWTAAEDFVVQVVGGPNERTEFHVDPYEEWFYQIKGDMHIEIMTAHGRERVDVLEGKMFLLPRNVRHSPQRPKGTLGIVIEHVRPPGTWEKCEWYCRSCDNLIHELDFMVTQLDQDFAAGIKAFAESVDARTCKRCGDVYELPS